MDKLFKVLKANGKKRHKALGIDKCVHCSKGFSLQQQVNQLPCNCFLHAGCKRKLMNITIDSNFVMSLGLIKEITKSFWVSNIDSIYKILTVSCPVCCVNLHKILYPSMRIGEMWKRPYLIRYVITMLDKRVVDDNIKELIIYYL